MVWVPGSAVVNCGLVESENVVVNRIPSAARWPYSRLSRLVEQKQCGETWG